MVALLLVGTAMLCGGLLTVVYGISIKEFGLGSTMIISGAVVTCTGLLLMGLAQVVRELKNLAPGLGSGVGSGASVADFSDAERLGTVIPTAMIPHADIRPAGKPDFATAPPPRSHAPLETSPSRLETSRLEGARLETPRLETQRPETRPARAAPRGAGKSDFLFAREEPISPNQAPERGAPDRFERPHPLAPSSPSAAQPPSAPWQDDPSAFAPPRAPERDFERAPEPAASRPPRREFLFASKRRDAQQPDTPAAGEAEPHPLAQEPARAESDQPEPSWRPAAPATPVEPEPEAVPPQVEPAEPHYQPPRRSEAAPVTVVKSGVVDAMAYSLYSDGSIEAQMPEGMVRFESIEELRAHLDQRGA